MELIDGLFSIGIGICLAVLLLGIWFDVLRTIK